MIKLGSRARMNTSPSVAFPVSRAAVIAGLLALLAASSVGLAGTVGTHEEPGTTGTAPDVTAVETLVGGDRSPIVTDVDVDAAVDRAVEFLWSRQRYDGTWIRAEFKSKYPLGLTALAAYTLRMAGTPPSDHRLGRAANVLMDRSDASTVFARSFSLLFWCSMSPERFRQPIADDVRFLKLHQQEEGGWSHGTVSGSEKEQARINYPDTRLALAALAEAASVGVDIPPRVWIQAEQCWLAGQNDDGGWGYWAGGDNSEPTAEYGGSYGMATGAGIVSLQAISDRLYLDAASPFNDRLKARCGQDVEATRAIRAAAKRGREWWNTHFRVDSAPMLDIQSPDDPRDSHPTDYLFVAARVGLLSGDKRFGDREWAREISAHLVRTQQADGSWGSVPQTCFGVLALCTARTPVLINKLRYGEGNEWNNDPRDAANLTQWFSRETDTPYTWQIVDIESGAADLHDAPVLLITGHDAPEFDESEQSLLRDYVNGGGTILAVACCSRESFVEGGRALFEGMFPRLSWAPLARDHPAWTLHDSVRPGDDCLGFDDTCRTGVFMLTNGSCCAWQQNLIKQQARHFALGGNILRYATFGQPLRGRLARSAEQAVSHPLGTLTMARLRHGGDWWLDPDSLEHLSGAMTASVGIGIDERPPVGAGELGGSGVDALWVTGRTFDAPSIQDQAQLRNYLLSGGTLIGSAYCGDEAFDRSFRAFGAEMFGPFAWEVVRPDDPIHTGKIVPGLSSPLGRVSYRPRFHGPLRARVDRPLLYGIRHGDRWLILYSPVDINTGVARQPCLDCVGYGLRDVQAIAANLFLYVATQKPPRESAASPSKGP